MSGVWVEAIIAAAGVLLSLIGAVFIAGFRWGEVRAEITLMKAQQSHMVTKEELQPIRDTLNEIKGMFKLTIKE